MSSEDRYSFVLPITIGGYLAAVLVIAGLVVYGGMKLLEGPK